jgi:hypothetical protein
MLMGWHHAGWGGHVVGVAQRREMSWWTSPVTLSDMVDHLSLDLLVLKPSAKASQCRQMARHASIGDISPTGECS